MSSYPTSVATFASHADTTDTIFAADINTPNAEIVALETGLLNGVQHNLSPLTDNVKDLGDATHAWKNLWTKGTTQFNGVAYTWPAADGAANQSLVTNGSKVLSWGSGEWTVISPTSVGTQNDFAPGLIGHTIVRCNNASLLTITGIAGGVFGQRIVFIPVGAGQVDFKFNDPGSLAANKLINFVTVGNTSMIGGTTSQAAVEFVYDSSARWMMVTHEQGAPITFTPTITFGGASVGQTYSTQTGYYYVKGKVLHYWGRLTFTAKGSSTGGVAIAGLPYTATTLLASYGLFTAPFYTNLASIVPPLMGYVAPSGVVVTLQMGNATSTVGLTDVNFTNTSDLVFSGTYALL